MSDAPKVSVPFQRRHVDPRAGDITPCTALMTYADWKALRAADWATLARRLGRRALGLYLVLTALSLVLFAQIVLMVSAFLRGGGLLALLAAALTAVLLLSFVTGERRLYRRQREVVDRLRGLAAGETRPADPQPRQAR
ncbi:MAG: hypothetical protein ACYTG2_17020 [Planctomycetota bacterium]